MMRNDQIIPMVKHGLKNVANFSGRDPRIRFWPYFGFVYIAGQAVSMLSIIPILQSVPMSPEEMPAAQVAETILPQFENVMLYGMITTAITMLLLASAVTRRFHDRNMRGYWALIPIVFLINAFWHMSSMLEAMFSVPINATLSESESFELLNSVVPVFAMNFLYLVSFIALCVFLGLKGDEGENRFGPPVIIK